MHYGTSFTFGRTNLELFRRRHHFRTSVEGIKATHAWPNQTMDFLSPSLNQFILVGGQKIGEKIKFGTKAAALYEFD